MVSKGYNVHLTGWVADGPSSAEAQNVALQTALGVNSELADQIIAKIPTVVALKVTQSQAEQFTEVLDEIGATYVVEPDGDAEWVSVAAQPAVKADVEPGQQIQVVTGAPTESSEELLAASELPKPTTPPQSELRKARPRTDDLIVPPEKVVSLDAHRDAPRWSMPPSDADASGAPEPGDVAKPAWSMPPDEGLDAKLPTSPPSEDHLSLPPMDSASLSADLSLPSDSGLLLAPGADDEDEKKDESQVAMRPSSMVLEPIAATVEPPPNTEGPTEPPSDPVPAIKDVVPAAAQPPPPRIPSKVLTIPPGEGLDPTAVPSIPKASSVPPLPLPPLPNIDAPLSAPLSLDSVDPVAPIDPIAPIDPVAPIDPMNHPSLAPVDASATRNDFLDDDDEVEADKTKGWPAGYGEMDVGGGEAPSLAPPAGEAAAAWSQDDLPVATIDPPAPIALQEPAVRAPSLIPSRVPPGPSRITPPTPATKRRPKNKPKRTQFWLQMPASFASPLLGAGLGWAFMLAMPAVAAWFVPNLYVRGACFVGIFCVITRLFTECAEAGRANQLGPDWPRMSNLMAEVILPGLAVLFLTGVLFALPAYSAYMVTKPAMDGALTRPDGVVEVFDPTEVFYDADGNTVKITLFDGTKRVRRADGTWVEVDPQGLTVRPAARFNKDLPVEVRLMHGWTDLGRNQTFVFVALALAFFYLPMALTLATFGSDAMRMFNLIDVMRGIFAGGLPYIAVVSAGFGVMSLAWYIAYRYMFDTLVAAGTAEGFLSSALLVLLVAYAYVSGVQGHMMGLLLASRPEAFEGMGIKAATVGDAEDVFLAEVRRGTKNDRAQRAPTMVGAQRTPTMVGGSLPPSKNVGAAPLVSEHVDPEDLCPSHRRYMMKKCLECGTRMCEVCHHFIINSRPWCPTCAQPHLPTAGTEIKDGLIFIGKCVWIMGVLGAWWVFVPGVMGKMSGSLAIGYFMMKWLFFKPDHHIHGVRIEEVRDGGEVVNRS